MAARGVQQRAVDAALAHDLGSVGAGQRGRTGEVRPPVFVRDVGELSEQQIQVRLVRAVPSGPARGEDARSAAEHIDAEP